MFIFVARAHRFMEWLRNFDVRQISAEHLRLVTNYTDNELFRPETLASISQFAAKFCALIIGVVQAHQYVMQQGHQRVDLIAAQESYGVADSQSVARRQRSQETSSPDDDSNLSFAEKLERRRRAAALQKQQEQQRNQETQGRRT